jgi:hypothetical protein
MQVSWVNKTPGFKNIPAPIYKNSFSFNMHLNLHKSILFYAVFLLLPIFLHLQNQFCANESEQKVTTCPPIPFLP